MKVRIRAGQRFMFDGVVEWQPILNWTSKTKTQPWYPISQTKVKPPKKEGVIYITADPLWERCYQAWKQHKVVICEAEYDRQKKVLTIYWIDEVQ